MEVVRLMGIERRSWTDKATGELKEYAGLHVVYEESPAEDGFVGKKCGDFSCPRECDVRTLKLGQTYALEYTHFQTKNGLGARISGLMPVEQEAPVEKPEQPAELAGKK